MRAWVAIIMIANVENNSPLVFAFVVYARKFSNFGRKNVKKEINKVDETVN